MRQFHRDTPSNPRPTGPVEGLIRTRSENASQFFSPGGEAENGPQSDLFSQSSISSYRINAYDGPRPEIRCPVAPKKHSVALSNGTSNSEQTKGREVGEINHLLR
jgi:hypothetical protein